MANLIIIVLKILQIIQNPCDVCMQAIYAQQFDVSKYKLAFTLFGCVRAVWFLPGLL